MKFDLRVGGPERPVGGFEIFGSQADSREGLAGGMGTRETERRNKDFGKRKVDIQHLQMPRFSISRT